MIWVHVLGVVAAGICSAPSALIPLAAPPEYYEVSLVSTGRVPGTARATGAGLMTFSPSPFGIALGRDGSYRYDIVLQTERMLPPEEGAYVAWVTTSDLSGIRLLGALDAAGEARGSVDWNQFLIVITLERSLAPDADGWQGPVVMRGLSRSGLLHTMAGHGPFEAENCASFGFN